MGADIDLSEVTDEQWTAMLAFACPGLNLCDERIRQLEKQCEVLAAEVDRMRPVVEAAQVLAVSLRRHGSASWSGSEELLERKVTEYESSKPK